MRSLRSRMRLTVRVYGKCGGSPCVFIPVLVARSPSPSPRSPLSQKRPRFSTHPPRPPTVLGALGPASRAKGALCLPPSLSVGGGREVVAARVAFRPFIRSALEGPSLRNGPQLLVYVPYGLRI